MNDPIKAPGDHGREADRSGSMVARTARRITERSLAVEAGAYLGSENDLIVAFGVSRPTLRQAARVVANNQLLTVRRGVNGGFFAARPDAQHVIEAPALWLRLQSATLEDMIQASTLIVPEAAARAALCPDASLIDELRRFRSDIDLAIDAAGSDAGIIHQETLLAHLIGRMSGNPVLALFGDIAYAFGSLERDFQLYRGSSQRRCVWLRLQQQFCDAILAGDPDRARSAGAQRGAQVMHWLTEDRTCPEER